MVIRHCIRVLLLGLVAPLALHAQEGDEKPLKDLSRSFVKAWSQGKAADLAALYAADAILTTPSGETLRGREAIQKSFQDDIAGAGKIALSGEEYRWLSTDAVAWRYEWKMTPKSGASSRGTGLAVLTRSGDSWQIAEDVVALTPASTMPVAPVAHDSGDDHGHDHGAGGHGHDH